MGTTIPNIGISAAGDPIGNAVVEIIADDTKYRAGLKKSERALRDFDKEQAKIIRDGAKGFAVLGTAIAAIGVIATKSFLTAAVQNERMIKGLEAVAGGANEANKQLEDLRETAKLPGLGLPEAIKASINLQAVGIEAEKSNIFIREMGNALASVGRGRADLEGVIRGMQQMTSRGKVLAEEINQISERVPQFRAAMQAAFGTATSEDIQKLGITVEEFLDKSVAELAKLPRVSGGAANAIENLTDSWREFRVEVGKFLLPTLIKTVDGISRMVEVLNDLSDAQKKVVGFGALGLAGGGTLVAIFAGIGLAAPGIAKTAAGMVALTKAVAGLSATAIGGLTIGGILAGIGTGLATFAAGLKLGTDQIDDTREALTGFDSVTKAQRNNIAKIEEGIAEWTTQLKGLAQAQQAGTTHIQRQNEVTKEWIDIPIAKQIEAVEGKLSGLNKALRIAKGDIFGIVAPTVAASQELTRFGRVIEVAFDPLGTISELFANLTKNVEFTEEALAESINVTREFYAAIKEDSGAIKMFNELSTAVNQFGTDIERVKKVAEDLIDIIEPDQSGRRTEFLQLPGFISDPDIPPRLETRAIDFGFTSPDILKQTRQLDDLNSAVKEFFANLNPFERSGKFIEEQKRIRIQAIDDALDEELKLIGESIERENALRERDNAKIKKAIEKSAKERAGVEADFAALMERSARNIVKSQEQAARDWARAWENAAGDVRDSTADLFVSIFSQDDENARRKLNREIRKLENAIAALVEAEAAGVEETDLLSVGIRDMGRSVAPVEDQIMRLREELDDLMDEAESQLTRWERFWDDLVDIAIRKVAEMVASEAFVRAGNFVKDILDLVESEPAARPGAPTPTVDSGDFTQSIDQGRFDLAGGGEPIATPGVQGPPPPPDDKAGTPGTIAAVVAGAKLATEVAKTLLPKKELQELADTMGVSVESLAQFQDSLFKEFGFKKVGQTGGEDFATARSTRGITQFSNIVAELFAGEGVAGVRRERARIQRQSAIEEAEATGEDPSLAPAAPTMPAPIVTDPDPIVLPVPVQQPPEVLEIPAPHQEQPDPLVVPAPDQLAPAALIVPPPILPAAIQTPPEALEIPEPVQLAPAAMIIPPPEQMAPESLVLEAPVLPDVEPAPPGFLEIPEPVQLAPAAMILPAPEQIQPDPLQIPAPVQMIPEPLVLLAPALPAPIQTPPMPLIVPAPEQTIPESMILPPPVQTLPDALILDEPEKLMPEPLIIPPPDQVVPDALVIPAPALSDAVQLPAEELIIPAPIRESAEEFIIPAPIRESAEEFIIPAPIQAESDAFVMPTPILPTPIQTPPDALKVPAPEQIMPETLVLPAPEQIAPEIAAVATPVDMLQPKQIREPRRPAELEFTPQQIMATTQQRVRRRPQREATDEDFRRRPGSRSVLDPREDTFVAVENLIVNLPDDARNMSRPELDKATSRQVASTARAFKRAPKLKRGLLR